MHGERPAVVARAPERYPRQQGLTCGEYNARGILDAFRIPYTAPASLRLRIRLFGYSFIEDIGSLLEAHGVSAPVRDAAKQSDGQRIDIIKQHIDADEPVIVAIGNGHLRRGAYSPIARVFIGHFITVYGYRDRQQIFYVYDPYLEGSYQGDIPVGNEVRTFGEFLRDWQGPFYYKLIRMDHVYIAASISR